jgi:hypothetical protein
MARISNPNNLEKKKKEIGNDNRIPGEMETVDQASILINEIVDNIRDDDKDK